MAEWRWAQTPTVQGQISDMLDVVTEESQKFTELLGKEPKHWKTISPEELRQQMDHLIAVDEKLTALDQKVGKAWRMQNA